MKVLFVASGNKAVGTVSSFVRSQYDSLADAGLNMCLFPIVGHRLKGYLANWKSLRHVIQTERPDIVHAHYSTCGILAWFATLGLRHRPKIIVSILGSFPKRNIKWCYVHFAVRYMWDATLTKSRRTANQLGLDLPIVPNGVNVAIFHPDDFMESRQKVGFEEHKQYIIWCSNPIRPEKNYALAEKAVQLLNGQRKISGLNEVLLCPVYNRTPDVVAQYMNGADCLLLTSMSEGSPNVIKEAMACNCPIVTTDVGDVEERLSVVTNHESQITNLQYLPGCYVIPADATPIYGLQGVGEWFERDAQCLAEALRKALDFGQRTNGHDRIMEDGLTIKQVAQKIVKIYESLVVCL